MAAFFTLSPVIYRRTVSEMGATMNVISRSTGTGKSQKKSMAAVQKSKSFGDGAVKKLTTAVSKVRITKRKDKDKVHPESAPCKETLVSYKEKDVKQEEERSRVSHEEPAAPKPKIAPLPSKGLPQHIVAATRVAQERKWTLTDLLQSLGAFVQKSCAHLLTVPSASEVAMWVRCADRALQLNGWTVNSFLIESHVVFTHKLLRRAFETFECRTLADVKELVLMCLYISYTYNANEISYPLRPFLVKQDRTIFWDKCTTLSLAASSDMLRLNQERRFYSDSLASLKSITLH